MDRYLFIVIFINLLFTIFLLLLFFENFYLTILDTNHGVDAIVTKS